MFRWRSSCINPGGTLLIVGWGGGPSWIPSKWNSFRPYKPICHNWYFWFQLLWPFSFSKYLYFHERTISISISFNSQVTKIVLVLIRNYPQCFLNSPFLLDLSGNLMKFHYFFLCHSFAFCFFIYTGVAICGFLMFGDSVKSQFSLNMPREFVASNIAIWTMV